MQGVKKQSPGIVRLAVLHGFGTGNVQINCSSSAVEDSIKPKR